MDTVKEFLLGLDKSIYFFFQDLQRPWLDYFLAWPTVFVSTNIILGLVCIAIFRIDRKKGFLKIPFAALCLWGNYWLTFFLKSFFMRPRPFIVWDDVHVIFGKPLDYSLPSGHTSVAFAAAFLLSFFYPGKMRWVYLLALWISVTRLYVGVHYLSDLFAGAMVGMICAAVSVWLYDLLREAYGKKNTGALGKS